MVPRLPYLPHVKTHVAMLLGLFALSGCAGTMTSSKAQGPRASEPTRITDLPVDAAGAHTPVVIAPEVLHGFSFLYQNITHTEFVLCLEGTRKNRQIFITGFRLAVITRSSIGAAAYEPCTNANYIGTAHNHPPVEGTDMCKASVPDKVSFYNDIRAAVDIILCGSTRYLWVLKDGRSDVDDGMSRVRKILASHSH